MSQCVALFTGTFDPFHAGHLSALRAAHQAFDIRHAVVVVNRANPNKPLATPWQKRMDIVRLATACETLPFTVEVTSSDYAYPAEIAQLVAAYGGKEAVVRVAGSDNVLAYIADKRLRPVLSLCRYVIIVRSLARRDELEAAIATLPDKVRAQFSFTIVADVPSFDATTARQNPQAALHHGMFTAGVYQYIRQANLYQLR